MIHLLYSHRIWIVGRDRSTIFRIIPSIVIVLSSGAAFVLIWVVYHHNPSTGLFLDRWTVFMALSVATFLDILITTSLWYLLASSRTGFAQTDCLISRLMCYTIDSGCLTSVCALVSIITCAVMPYNFIFLSIQFIMAKLYINSYIALLNTRYYTQHSTDTIDSFELRREPPNSGVHNLLQEKFRSFQMNKTHPEIEVVPPTRPLAVVASRRSVLVTVEKESFIDI